MKTKRIAFCVMLIALILSSCTQYVLVPMPDLSGNDYSISDLIEDISNANNGDRLKLKSLEIDLYEDALLLPINVDKSISISGSIDVKDSSPSSAALYTRAVVDKLNLFKVSDNASLSIENLSVDIKKESAVEKLNAIVSVDGSAHVSISDVKISKPSQSEEKVYAVYLGETATSESIDIKGTEPVEIEIAPENINKTEIVKDLESSTDIELDIKTGYEVATETELSEALEKYNSVILTDDIEISCYNFDDGKVYLIDLNNHTLSFSTDEGLNISNDSELRISNGNIRYEFADSSYAIGVTAGGAIEVNNIDMYSATDAFFIVDDASKISIKDSYIDSNGVYGLSTNASKAPRFIQVDINNSEIYANGMQGTEASGIGILFNIDGVLNISNSHIQGGWQGVIARGGEVNILDGSSIVSTGGPNASGDNEFLYLFDDSFGINWGQGNQVAYAALVVGNAQSNAYKYNTKVSISDDSTVEMHRTEGHNEKAATIFIASANGYEARLYTNNNDYVNDIIENDWIWGDKCFINDSTEALQDPDLI